MLFKLFGLVWIPVRIDRTAKGWLFQVKQVQVGITTTRKCACRCATNTGRGIALCGRRPQAMVEQLG